MRAPVRALYWRRRFQHFGHDSFVGHPSWLAGAHRMSIGERTTILGGCWLAVLRRAWARPDAALMIGSGVWIGPACTLSAAESLIIEDDVGIGSYSLVVDSDHRLDGPDDQIGLNPPMPRPVRIGRATAVMERVSILAGANIGRHCIIGTNSVVRGTIPDHSIVAGIPARIVGTTTQD